MKTKLFDIPKQQVMQAYRLVKANSGAAGISIALVCLLTGTSG